MAAGVSITITAGIDDFTLRNQTSRNLALVHGVLNYDSASSTALTITAANLGLSRIDALFVQPKQAGLFEVASVSAYEWTIQPLVSIASVTISATGAYTCVTSHLVSTLSIGATVTGVPFFAFGYR